MFKAILPVLIGTGIPILVFYAVVLCNNNKSQEHQWIEARIVYIHDGPIYHWTNIVHLADEKIEGGWRSVPENRNINIIIRGSKVGDIIRYKKIGGDVIVQCKIIMPNAKD